METESGMEIYISMKSAWCNSLSQAGQQLVTPGCDDHNVHGVLCVSFPFTDAESNQDYQSGQWFKCHKIFLRNFVYCIEFYSH